MAKIQVRQSRGKLLWMMFSCVVMAIAGGAMLRAQTSLLTAFGLCFLLVFAGLFVHLLWRFCKPAVLLTIDDEGFFDHSKSKALGFVGWEKVHNVSLIRHDGEMYLSILMDDPDGVVERVSRGLATKTKKKGDGDDVARLHIPTVFIDRKPKQLYELMVSYVQAHREGKEG